MRNAQPHFCFETMIKKVYSLLLAVFFAGMICAEENGSAGMLVSADASADAPASSAPSFGNDGIDRTGIGLFTRAKNLERENNDEV